MARDTNAGRGGVIVVVKDHTEEMEAFDNLPPRLKSALRNAKLQFSAKEVETILATGQMTEAQIIEAINGD